MTIFLIISIFSIFIMSLLFYYLFLDKIDEIENMYILETSINEINKENLINKLEGNYSIEEEKVIEEMKNKINYKRKDINYNYEKETFFLNSKKIARSLLFSTIATIIFISIIFFNNIIDKILFSNDFYYLLLSFFLLIYFLLFTGLSYYDIKTLYLSEFLYSFIKKSTFLLILISLISNHLDLFFLFSFIFMALYFIFFVIDFFGKIYISKKYNLNKEKIEIIGEGDIILFPHISFIIAILLYFNTNTFINIDKKFIFLFNESPFSVFHLFINYILQLFPYIINYIIISSVITLLVYIILNLYKYKNTEQKKTESELNGSESVPFLPGLLMGSFIFLIFYI